MTIDIKLEQNYHNAEEALPDNYHSIVSIQES